MQVSQIEISSAVSRWTARSFILRSGYYAGRGPNAGDLNSPMLEMIYQGLKKEVCPEAAKNFVRLVNKLDDLSASSFIVAFETFWARGCKEIMIQQADGDRMRLSGRGAALEAEAFGAIASALFGPKLDSAAVASASRGIKQQFISSHLSEIPPEEIRKVPARSF